ncbi:sulfotransferase family protein [Microbulbifer sp. SA54]|uniref:sulfotransferase family protein n=1 Tax=Microbulbifer sp. SA54 TaxID=3401577 RepID=UPI003AAE1426
MNSPIIGASLGRTGTYSLKLALERLGFGPCLHMSDFVSDPELCRAWLRELTSSTPDWQCLLGDRPSCVDWPGCMYVDQILQDFPKARFIFVERPFEDWLASIRQTILPALQWSTSIPASTRSPFIELARHVVLEKTFAGQFDRDSLAVAYDHHRHTILTRVPRNQLLLLDIAQGWEPLCEFLACAIPEDPFPRTNSAGDFIQTMRRTRRR